jgi:hypothetical protein
MSFTAKAFHKATISSTAKSLTDMGFTASELAGISKVQVSIESDDVRYLCVLGGSSPTATDGHKLLKDNVYILDLGNVLDFKLIRITNDATVQVSVGN